MAMIFGRRKARDKPTNQVSNAPQFLFGKSSSGAYVTPKTAIQMPIVYACVRVISETIASLPFCVYKESGDGVEKAHEHPLYNVLHNEPNPEMSSFTWRETVMSHLLLWGNSYNQIIRNGRGDVTGLYPLNPEFMEVDRANDNSLFYTYTKTDGTKRILGTHDVLHIPALGFDGIIGYSPIALEKKAIGLGVAAEEYGSRVFENNAVPAGILTHPGVVKDASRIRDNWHSNYGGSRNAGKVAVLEEGMKFEAISMPNSEAQFLETRKFQVAEICRIFRMPPHMVGDLENATYSNIENQSINFGVHTIRPWCVRIEQAMNRSLFKESEKSKYYVSLNMDGLMRGSYKERMEGYAIARQNGWMSTNDIRSLENMNPVPADEGGDAYLVNGTMIPITTAMNKTNEGDA